MNRRAVIVISSRAIVLLISVVLFAQVCLAKYSGGTGEPNAPYQIANKADLLTLADDINDYNKCFVLTADIDLNPNLTGGQVFTAAVIAYDVNHLNHYYDGNGFEGIFDGAGHKISNLTIDIKGARGDFLGLFGFVSKGEIKNLGLENAFIRCGDDSEEVGVLAGCSSSYINHCFSTGSIKGDDSLWGVGGLVGGGYNNICKSISTVDITTGDFPWNIGGLAGICQDINNSYSTGSITIGNKAEFVGGLVGFCDDGAVWNCYAVGKIKHGRRSDSIGGLMGYFYVDTSGGIVIICTDNVNSGNIFTKAVDCSYGRDLTENCYFLEKQGPNNGLGKPLTDRQMRHQSNFVDWDFNNVWYISEGVDIPKLIWQLDMNVPDSIQIDKFFVTAACTENTGRISFVGLMGAMFYDFNNADKVTITIDSWDMDSPYIQTFDINAETFKNSKFKGSVVNKYSKTSFAFDTKKQALSFSASNVDLTGLSCPVNIEIAVGSYTGQAHLNDTIVNGIRPIPINLLMGVKNSLRVDKSKFTNKAGVITQFTVSGGFSHENINDMSLLTNPLDVNIGSQTFTIPAGNFKNTKGKFTCSKVVLSGGEIAATTFDFNKCTFTLTIKGTKITDAAGTAGFNMEFGVFSEGAEVLLP